MHNSAQQIHDVDDEGTSLVIGELGLLRKYPHPYLCIGYWMGVTAATACHLTRRHSNMICSYLGLETSRKSFKHFKLRPLRVTTIVVVVCGHVLLRVVAPIVVAPIKYRSRQLLKSRPRKNEESPKTNRPPTPTPPSPRNSARRRSSGHTAVSISSGLLFQESPDTSSV